LGSIKNNSGTILVIKGLEGMFVLLDVHITFTVLQMCQVVRRIKVNMTQFKELARGVKCSEFPSVPLYIT